MYAVQIVVFTLKKIYFFYIHIMYSAVVYVCSVHVKCICTLYIVHVQCMCTVYTEHYKVHKLKCVKKTYIS